MKRSCDTKFGYKMTLSKSSFWIQRVKELEERKEELFRERRELWAEIAQLKAENARLQGLLGQERHGTDLVIERVEKNAEAGQATGETR